ncbi:MAG: hypothetical protein AAFQ87_17260 [Bacteroidota bacterium]
MKYLAFLFFLSFLSPLLGQDTLDMAEDTVSYIVVGKEDRFAERQTPSLPSRNDFYRNMLIWRLPLQHRQNLPLIAAVSPNQQGGAVYANAVDGMVLNLIEGLRSGEAKARHPQDLARKYDYFDLLYDLMELEGLHPDSLEEGLAVDELGWDRLNEYVDLIVEEGFSQHDSRAFMRIKFVRLLWHNPQSVKGVHVLAIFPYTEVSKVLEDLYYPFLKHGRKMRIRLIDFLQTQMFWGHKLGLGEDKAFNLPPHRRSEAALRNRWPELWHN